MENPAETMPVPKNDLPQLAADLIEVFEDFLGEKGIIIQNDERAEAVEDGERPEDLANIYGTDFGTLQSGIEDVLTRWKLVKTTG